MLEGKCTMHHDFAKLIKSMLYFNIIEGLRIRVV